MSEHKLGTFEVTSGQLVISDPCYDLGTWCQAKGIKAKNGTWTATVIKQDMGQRSNRCVALEAFLTGNHLENVTSEAIQDDLGVDSGQLGIFDQQFYRDDNVIDDKFIESLSKEAKEEFEDFKDNSKWYAANVCKTLSEELKAGVIPYGCVSSSGFGDGSYKGFLFKYDDEVVGVRVIFIDEDEVEEEDEYFEEDEMIGDGNE